MCSDATPKLLCVRFDLNVGYFTYNDDKRAVPFLTDFRISTFYTMTSAFIQLAASSHYSQARYPHTHNLTLTRFD